jgi:hypothetical protein
MTANLLYLLNDCTNFTNFSQWASQISVQLQLAGWIQSNDTGQIMWTGMTISAVTATGTTSVYTYASLTGLPLKNGRALTITGMASGVNNGTFVITSFTGTTSGTFTVTNAASGVTASAQSGVVTIATVVPGASVTVYEIWQPNDSLTNFFLKMEYGNAGAANAPVICATLSTATSGTGTPTGFVTSRFVAAVNNPTAASATVPWECRFSGGTSYFGALMWRGVSTGQLVYVERSVNASGVYTNTHVTLVVIGNNIGGSSTITVANQQSLYLQSGLGACPVVTTANNGNAFGGLSIVVPNPSARSNLSFNGTVPVDFLSPVVGLLDYPLLGLAGVSYASVAEGQTLTVSVYGSNHTYFGTQVAPFSQAFQGSPAAGNCLLMRYE